MFFSQLVAGGWFHVALKTLICIGVKARSSMFIRYRVCWKGAVHALLLMASWMIQPSIGLHLFLHFEKWFWSGNLEYLTIQGAEDNSSHYLIDSWPKSGAWILIWGLLNLTTWEPKNTIQNYHLWSCSSIGSKHKVIMTQLITILLFLAIYPVPKATNLGEGSLVACLFYRYVCWIHVSPPWWDKVAEWCCWEVQIWLMRFRCVQRRDFPSCDFMRRRLLVLFTYVTINVHSRG